MAHLQVTNANFPMDGEGRVHHVGVKRGEVANRIITVGAPSRAKQLASYMDANPPVFHHSSSRGFEVYTGRYKRIPLTIIAIGMGLPMMDFFVREVRAIVDGPLFIIRFGSCGTINDQVRVGSVIVSSGSALVTRNHDAFSMLALARKRKKSLSGAYNFSRSIAADSALSNSISQELRKSFSDVFLGGNVSADSFYSSQGRLDANFIDDNVDLIKRIKKSYPDALSLEMENYQLFHLANCAVPLLIPGTERRIPGIRSAAAMMVFANRLNNDFLSPQLVPSLQEKFGLAILEALVNFPLDEETQSLLHSEQGSVWQTVLQ